MDSKVFEKFEIPTKRGKQKNCAICGEQFKLIILKEHQCKRCLRPVCSKCGNTKRQIYKQGFVKHAHRLCDICKKESQEICNYVLAQKLAFGQMSQIGRKWMKKILKVPPNNKVDDKKYKKFTKQVFYQIWDSYNYSIRQLMGILTFNLNQDQVYDKISNVYTTVISAVPQQKFQSIIYVIIFLLCFCSVDKATIICLYLIQLKNAVTDHRGLVSVYLKALGVPQDQNRNYIDSRTRKFINTYSVNCTTFDVSVYLLSRVIQRKRIEEIHMALASSLQAFKQQLLQSKDNFIMCDAILLRNCDTQILTSKYRQLGSIKVGNFIREDSPAKQSQVSITSDLSIRRKLTSSFAQNSIIEEAKIEKTEEQFTPIHPFRRKATEEESFAEDSFSVISMIADLKEMKNFHNDDAVNSVEENMNILTTANGTSLIKQQKESFSSSSQKIQSDKFFGSIQEEPIYETKLYQSKSSIQTKQTSNPKQSYSKQSQRDSKQSYDSKSPCQNCQSSQNQLKKISNTLQTRQQQIIKLKNKLAQSQKQCNYLKNINSSLSSNTQLQNLRKVSSKYQLIEEELNTVKRQNFQLKKSIKKAQSDAYASRQQLQQALTSVKMLKNKSQTQALTQNKYQYRNDDSNDLNRVNEMLKTSLMEKNQQLEELLKKNKIANYQIEEMRKAVSEDSEKIKLKQEVAKLQKQKADVYNKLTQLSKILMQEESEKLYLSEENFNLKQILNANNIKVPLFQQN